MSDSDYSDSDPTEDFFKASFPPKTFKLTVNNEPVKGLWTVD